MSFLVEPSSAAVVVGLSAMFQCWTSQNSSSAITWKFQPHNTNDDTERIIARNCQLSDNNGRYRLRKEIADTSCDLIIQSTTLNDAGIYICQQNKIPSGETEFVSAGLVIIDGDPDCSQNTTEAEEGQWVNYTCLVRYRGGLAPSFHTSVHLQGDQTSNGTVILDKDYSLDTTLVLAARPEIKPVTTEVQFFKPYPNVTSNQVPTYEFKWTSDPVTVVYKLTSDDIIIKRTANESDFSQTLTCECKSLSPVEISWTEPGGRVITEDTIVIEPEEGQKLYGQRYVCTVTNRLGSASSDISIDIVYNSVSIFKLQKIVLLVVFAVSCRAFCIC